MFLYSEQKKRPFFFSCLKKNNNDRRHRIFKSWPYVGDTTNKDNGCRTSQNDTAGKSRNTTATVQYVQGLGCARSSDIYARRAYRTGRQPTVPRSPARTRSNEYPVCTTVSVPWTYRIPTESHGPTVVDGQTHDYQRLAIGRTNRNDGSNQSKQIGRHGMSLTTR